MEKVYPRVEKTDIAEAYTRNYGKGRVIYFPWDIDRVFWEVLSVDHLRLMRNALNLAAGEAHPVSVTGPGVLDVTYWQQKNSITVHLVNLTNPMMMKGPIRELIPVGKQELKIRLPEGVVSRRVRLLAADKTIPSKRANGTVEVTVPGVLDHEIVAIDLG
jgi:hypothetical protein